MIAVAAPPAAAAAVVRAPPAGVVDVLFVLLLLLVLLATPFVVSLLPFWPMLLTKECPFVSFAAVVVAGDSSVKRC